MKNKRILIFTFLSIVLFSIVMYFSFIKTSNSIKNERLDEYNKQRTVQDELDSENIDIKAPSYEKVDGITNILLIGADYRENDTSARSDSMMILTIDTNNDKIKLTSLLRDMLVYIPGYGKSKLNHAFAYGEEELLMETIKYNFGITLDKYMIIDFNGFKDTIDTLGGVEVTVEEDELAELNKYVHDLNDSNAIELSESGTQVLDGTQALAYVRIRYNCGGEERRTARQRAVLNSLYLNFKNTSFTKYPSLIKSVISNVKTNLTFTEMLNLTYTALKLDISKIETLQLPIEEVAIGGIYGDYGWVFRTDLSLLSQLLADYIWLDKEVDLSNYDLSNLTYMN